MCVCGLGLGRLVGLVYGAGCLTGFLGVDVGFTFLVAFLVALLVAFLVGLEVEQLVLVEDVVLEVLVVEDVVVEDVVVASTLQAAPSG